MANTNDVPDFARMAELFFTNLSPHIAEKAKGFFKGSFIKEGFTDQSFIGWPKRKDNETHKILTSSQALRDSIVIAEATKDRVSINAGAGLPYAAIHNTGGVITVRVTEKFKRFCWYMFKKTDDDKWKWMALTKKEQFKITIPQRKFIGESAQLLKEIDQLIIEKIKQAQAAVMR